MRQRPPGEGVGNRKRKMANAGPVRGLPLKVFIADDSQPVADMLTELISDPGRIEVVGVGDTESATMDSIRRLKPDVVVLDLQLRTGSGTDVIRAVRSDPSLASLRLLVTSNHTSPQLKAGCLELGAEAYYDKVKELGELAAKLSELALARGG
jgi:DNA-binding NarL/FixJ family response regulator